MIAVVRQLHQHQSHPGLRPLDITRPLTPDPWPLAPNPFRHQHHRNSHRRRPQPPHHPNPTHQSPPQLLRAPRPPRAPQALSAFVPLCLCASVPLCLCARAFVPRCLYASVFLYPSSPSTGRHK